MIALLVVMAASPALTEAARCYEELDYTCAEERLAWALAEDLEDADMLRARLYEARLAIAFRDTQRARRAVRAIFAQRPTYLPGNEPPALLSLFDEERPPPEPPPQVSSRVDFLWLELFGPDAARWSEGLGVEGAVGVVLFDALALDLRAGYSDHVPLEILDVGLELLRLELGAAWRTRLGPLALSVGVAGGAGKVDIDGVLRDERYWGALLGLSIGLGWTAWQGLGIDLTVSPSLFIVPEDERAAGSFFLPVGMGLRYLN